MSNSTHTPRGLDKGRWRSPNGRNFAYTTRDGKGLFIVIAKRNYYFSEKWPAPKGKK